MYNPQKHNKILLPESGSQVQGRIKKLFQNDLTFIFITFTDQFIKSKPSKSALCFKPLSEQA